VIIQTCFGNGVLEGVEFNWRGTLNDLIGSRGTRFPEIMNPFRKRIEISFLWCW